MGEWPKVWWHCNGCDEDAVEMALPPNGDCPNPDIEKTWIIPADLGRELYEALQEADDRLDIADDGAMWSPRVREALARYESEVDPVPGGMSSGEGEAG